MFLNILSRVSCSTTTSVVINPSCTFSASFSIPFIFLWLIPTCFILWIIVTLLLLSLICPLLSGRRFLILIKNLLVFCLLILIWSWWAVLNLWLVVAVIFIVEVVVGMALRWTDLTIVLLMKRSLSFHQIRNISSIPHWMPMAMDLFIVTAGWIMNWLPKLS